MGAAIKTQVIFMLCFLAVVFGAVAVAFAFRILQTVPRTAPRFTGRAALALLWTACSLSAQTIQNFKIDPDPITYNGKSYFLGARAEKVVDFFTSTTTPSVVLGLNGTQGGLWFYQSSGGLNGWGANPTSITKTLGTYYERAKSIRFPGRTWPDLVVSAPALNGSTTGTTILFLNPLNPGGSGNPSAVWQQIIINAGSGCHDIKLADMDGDGLQDVVCTGGAFLPGSYPFIAYQTSNLSVWTVVTNAVSKINLGDGVAVYSSNGINNVIGCQGSNTYIWENPLNFGGNPRTQAWPIFAIGPGATGNALGNLPGNMGVTVADSEEGTTEPPWTYGLIQLAPPAGNIFTTPWILTEIDSTVRTAHEINGGTLPWNSQPYVVFAEQEQRSAHCNSNGYFSAPDNGACRVGYYTYSDGAWTDSPVIVSTLGTQNQSVIDYNGGLLIAGSNFGTAGAYDLSLQLWEITSGGSQQNAPTPQISPAGGTFTSPQPVSITDPASNPTIYYTTDGSTPTVSSQKYTGSFTLSANATVQAIATASGDTQSAIASASFTFRGQTAPPQFSPAPGNYSSAQSVMISDTTAGAIIYYTTDGSVPGTSSPVYGPAVHVDSGVVTINAMAQASGLGISSVSSATYTIQMPVTATPTFSPGAGTYSSTQSVTLSDTTSGAVIYYTTDGSTPTTSSAVFGPSIVVNSNLTLKAIAVASGFAQSAVASAAYLIQTGGGGSSINFSSGFPNASGLQLNGSAKVTGGSLEVTDGKTGEGNSVFWTTPVNIQNFTTNFSFQLLSAQADGFTFVMQNAGPTVVGASGGSLGYGTGSGGIQNSVAIKFDIFNNDGEGTDSTGIYLDGANPTLPAVDLTSSGIVLSSGDTIAAQLSYDGTTLTLNLTDMVTGDTFSHAFTVDIPGTVGANTAYAGFTGGTGGLAAIQNINTWSFAAGSGSMPIAANPTFNPLPGTYTSAQNVMLQSTSPGAILYYTSDGSTPTHSSSVYGAPIAVSSASLTIRALAAASGYQDSPVVSGTYQIQPVAPIAATPAFNPVSGTTFPTTLSVSISDSTPEATIYYTTDGSAPGFGSTAYTTSFNIAATTTVRAIAVASGYTQSAQGSATYTYAPVTANAPVSDEFGESSLNATLWTVRAPAGGSASVVGGELVISVPAGSNHDATTPALDAVQVVQSIGNANFDVALKIDSTLISATQYSEQGLLVEGDAKDYIRFEIGAGGTTTVLGVSAVSAGVSSSKIGIVPFASYAVPTYLRLQRVGTTYTAYWSTNGTTWTQAGTFSDSLVVTGLAPFAGNYDSTPSKATGLTARFDWFHNRVTDGP